MFENSLLKIFHAGTQQYSKTEDYEVKLYP